MDPGNNTVSFDFSLLGSTITVCMIYYLTLFGKFEDHLGDYNELTDHVTVPCENQVMLPSR